MTVTAGAGQYLENALLAVFRGTTFPAVPANFYLALYTTPPVNGVTAGSTEVPSSNNYSRFSFVPNITNFVAPTGAAPAVSLNGAKFVFATPSGSWGTITGWGLLDASSAGNLWAYGTFAPITPVNGDTVEFLTSNLSLSVT